MPERSQEDMILVAKENLLEVKENIANLSIMSNAHLGELAEVLRSQYIDHEYVSYVVEDCRLNCADRVILARAIANFPDVSADLLPFDEAKEPPGEPMTAYFRNSISDLAFRVFSREIRELRATYFDSLFACSEDVYSGSSDYCMLPILDYNDGDMWSVRRLIDKHELSLVMTLDLPTSADESNHVRFALLSRDLHVYPKADRLRITAFFDDLSQMPEFFKGCTGLGAKALSISALPYAFYDLHAFDVDFMIDPADFKALGVYFSLFYPRITVNGIYRHLKTM